MTDLNDALRELARRGTPRGATSVYEQAREDAASPLPRKATPAGRSALRFAAAAAVVIVIVGAVLLIFRNDDKVVDRPPSLFPKNTAVPNLGGALDFGLEVSPAGGFCLPSAQLNAGGLQVAAAVFDTLTAPVLDTDGSVHIAPSLASRIDHDKTYKTWTITLRRGVTFHDGEPLNADAVVKNLDAYRAGPQFGIILDQIATVTTAGNDVVVVKTSVPWVAFDSFLWSGGRLGIVAPRQLSDPTSCSTKLIGTGPFRYASDDGKTISVVRNPTYWGRDTEGRHLPYLDRIEFRRPAAGAGPNAAVDRLRTSDVVQTSDPQQITRLRTVAQAAVTENDRDGGVSYLMLNASAVPFDDRSARLALAETIDWSSIIAKTQGGAVEPAQQPFPEGVVGHVDVSQLGSATHDPSDARRLVQEYQRRTGRSLSFDLTALPDRTSAAVAALIKSQANAVGIDVNVRESSPADTTNRLIAGAYGAVLWTNYAGDDPDLQRVWWTSSTARGGSNLLNFGHLRDQTLDDLLVRGRSEIDSNARANDYKQVTRLFARENYNLWGWYVRKAIATTPKVHGSDEVRDNGTVSPALLWKAH